MPDAETFHSAPPGPLALAEAFLGRWEGKSVHAGDTLELVNAALGDARATDHQRAALIAFAWLAGAAGFAGADVLKWHLRGAYETASHAFALHGRTSGQVAMLADLGRLYRGED